MADARAVTLALLAERAAGATICPSEVARGLAGAKWRNATAEVHVAVDALAADGTVRLSWKGTDMAKRAGPYRIALAGNAGDRPLREARPTA